MKRTWIWLTALVVLLAAACRPSAPPHVAPTPAPHVAPAVPPIPPHSVFGYNASPSFYDNLKSLGYFYVTDPQFGAIGNSLADDTAAIVAADAAAKAALGTVVFPPPPQCYKTTAEIGIHWAAHWLGYSQNVNQPTLCARGTGMRSVVELRSTFGEGAGATPGFLDNAPTRAHLENLTIDAGSGAAEVGLLLNGAADSWLQNLHVINATEYGIRNAAAILPATISGVTVGGTGGSPTTGMSFTQSDPNFLNGSVFGLAGGASPLTLVVKISNPGALSTATYVLSTDGGATFTTLTYPLVATYNLAKSDGIHYQGPLGITGHFPAGTYVAGTTYSVTVTPTNADIVQPEADNNLVIYDTLVIAQSGTIYATPATFLGQYNGFTFTATASGTAGTTAGSQIVTGSGTTWLSQVGCDYGRGAIRVGGTIYEVATVLDDTHLVVVSSPLPAATASGLEYAMSCGAGFYEDGTNENNYTRWIDGDLGQDSIGMMLAAARGMEIDGVHVNSTGLAGIVEGASVDSSVAGALLNKVHTASGTFGSHGVPYIISPNSSGQMNEPQGLVVVGGDPTSWFLRGGGLDGPLANNIGPISRGSSTMFSPQNSVEYVSSTQTVASSTTLTLPDASPSAASGHTSFIQLVSGGPVTLTASPVLPNPNVPGVIVVLRNANTLYPITIPDNNMGFFGGFGFSGIQFGGTQKVLAPGDSVTLISTTITASPWTEMGAPSLFGSSFLSNTVGNTGETRVHPVPTTGTTPVNLLKLPCGDSQFGAGSGIAFDVFAQSGTASIFSEGADIAHWRGFIQLDGLCNVAAYTIDFANGNGISSLGWSLTYTAGSATVPFLFDFIGDSSSNPVSVTAVYTHRDPGVQ